MGANRGHQLGLRLRAAPLPGRLHPGGSCERLDRAEHPGVTAQWLPRPGRRREGKRHAGRPPSPRGVQVAGGGPAGGRVQFYCIFYSNKEPFVPSLLVHHLHVTAKTMSPGGHQGPEVREGVGGEKGLREGHFPQTPPLGLGVQPRVQGSLLCERSPSWPKHPAAQWGKGGAEQRLRLSLGRGPR